MIDHKLGKSTLIFVLSFIKGQKFMWSTFVEVAERHLGSGAPPGGLEELHQGAELWAFNTDFSLEFPQPLLPYTVLVGGVLNQPAKPLEQVSCLDTFPSKSSVKLYFTFSNLIVNSFYFLFLIIICIVNRLASLISTASPTTHFWK